MVRYVRPEERLAEVIKVNRRAAREANIATGTEKAQTAADAEQAAINAGAALEQVEVLEGEIELLTLVPKPVTGITVSSNAGVWSTAGPLANVGLSWSAVSKSIDDVDVTIKEYEVWRGDALVAVVPGLSHTVKVATDVTEQFRVRAVAESGAVGDFSTVVSVTGAKPSVQTGKTPTGLTITSALGVAVASWAGSFASAPATNSLMNVRVNARVGTSGAWVLQDFIDSARAVNLKLGTVGDTVQAQAVAYDRLGRVIGTSATVSTVVQGVKAPELDITVSQVLDTASQDAADAKAAADIAVKSMVDEWATSASATVAPTTGWSSTPPSWSAGTYIWVRTTITYGDDSTSTSDPVVVTGNPGAKGDDGAPGSPGTPGADGRGIVSTEIRYQAGSSGTTTPTGTWQSSVPTVSAGQYLWTRTTVTYTSGTPSVSYSVGRMGTNGSNGAPGAPGADGQTSYLHVAYATNATGTTGFSTTDPSGKTYMGTYTDFVEADSTDPTKYKWSLIKGADGSTGQQGPAGKGISSTEIRYQAGSSGTTAPTGTWNASVPSVSAGQFLWTRTVINFTDGASTTTYSVGRMGQDGSKGDTGTKGDTGAPGADGRSVTSVDVMYYLSTSATTQTGGSWVTNPPTWIDGRYMWTKTVVAYSTGSPSETDPVNTTGAKGATGSTGSPGAPGVGISSTVVNYASHTSGTSAPSTGWQTAIPTVAQGNFLWTRTVITYTDSSTSTAYTVARMGANGSAGAPGAPGNDGSDGRGVVSIVEEYYLSTSSTAQSGGSWVTTPPAWADGKYYWTRSKITYTDSSVVTTTPVNVTGAKGSTGAKGNTGDTGTSVTSVTRFYHTGTSAPAKPTVNPAPSPWTTTEPAYVAGQSLYYTDMTLLSTGAFIYSNVQKSSSYEVAAQALVTASGKNKIYDSTANATGSSETAGDQWRKWDKLTAGRKLLASWTWNGSAWIADALSETYLPLVNIGSGTYGELSGQRLTADSVKATAIDMDAGFATKFWANEGNFGAVKVDFLEPNYGEKLNITANESVEFLVGRQNEHTIALSELEDGLTVAQGDADTAASVASQALANAAIADGKALVAQSRAQDAIDGLGDLQAVVRITPAGVEVGTENGAAMTRITPTAVELVSGGQVSAELTQGRLIVSEAKLTSAQIGGHFIEKAATTGTVFRKV